MNANGIDQAIVQVEKLYKEMTGREMPVVEGGRPIPPERDAAQYVEEQMQHLMSMIGGARQPQSQVDFVPALSCYDCEKETIICLDVPGIKKDSLDLSFTSHSIVVSGVRQTPWEAIPATTAPEGKKTKSGNENKGINNIQVRGAEQRYGNFRREIPMPMGIRAEQVKAECRDGVLEIRIPLEQPEAPKAERISIK